MKSIIKYVLGVTLGLLSTTAYSNKETPVTVTDSNYSTAFWDVVLQKRAVDVGGDNALHHIRTLMPLDQQPVPMINVDTIYSWGVFDARTDDFTITIPELDGRYVSAQVYLRGHHDGGIKVGSGTHTIKAVGDWVGIAVRIQSDGTAIDSLQVNRWQNQIKIDFLGAERESFKTPSYNMQQLQAMHIKWQQEARKRGVLDAFGKKGEITIDARNRGVAMATGMFPSYHAIYVTGVYTLDPTQCYTATYDVPEVTHELGFYSITVYGDDDYLHTSTHNNINDMNVVLDKGGKTFTAYYGEEAVCGAVSNRLAIPTKDIMVSFRLYLPNKYYEFNGFKLPEPEPL